MGGILGKCHGKEGRAQVQALNRRIDELEAKLRQVTYKRACEKRAQVRREAAWSRERAQMQEQLDALSECWAWCREGEGEGEGVVGVKVMAGMMREEQARHDEAVERWKRLYLAIKSELDHLVQRAAATSAIVPTPTVSPKKEGWCMSGKEIERMEMELKCKDELIEGLRASLRSSEREVDILKQSLRILTNSSNSKPVLKVLPHSLLMGSCTF